MVRRRRAADQTDATHVSNLMGNDGATALVPGLWALEVGSVILRSEARAWLNHTHSAEFWATLQEKTLEVDGESSPARAMTRCNCPGPSAVLRRRCTP